MKFNNSVMITLVLIGVMSSEADGVNVEKSQDKTTRTSRFISFQTTNDNIRVDLDFSIPFLTIPVRKTWESMGSSDIFSSFPSVNLNVAGAALGGGVVLASTLLLPLLIRTLALDSPDRPYARLLDNTEFSSDALLSSVTALVAGDTRVPSCARRLACCVAGHTAGHSRAGITSLLREVASNSIVSSLLNATAIDAAIRSGYGGHNCTALYDDCPISHDNMRLLMNNLAKLGKL